MKCNVRELSHLSDKPCIIEGRLNYKKIYNGAYRSQAVFKERWFRLINNYLFYFKISEMGKFDTKFPAGVFVMENSSIQMEHGQGIPFSFSISFIDDPDKRHIFAARAEDNVVNWVIKLRECSYEYLRNRLHTLQSKIFSITGKDPLLMVPRNDGACLWAPAIPYSTTPACTVNTSSFSCHLHTNSAFTLERSKSDVQAYKYFENNKQTKFYTEIPNVGHDKTENGAVKNVVLERSRTSALFNGRASPFDEKIFDSSAYVRAAPSPPARRRPPARVAPPAPCAAPPPGPDVSAFAARGRRAAGGAPHILDDTPRPPRRKVSPRPTPAEDSVSPVNASQSNEDDLIKF